MSIFTSQPISHDAIIDHLKLLQAVPKIYFPGVLKAATVGISEYFVDLLIAETVLYNYY